MIGATRTESSTTCTETLVCDPEFYYTNCYGATADPMLAYECRNCWQQVCNTYTTTYNQPSDGLLHQSTQIGQTTRAIRSNWNPNAAFEALGANHNEYDEHPGTRIRFERIFDVLDGTPAFFRTARR